MSHSLTVSLKQRCLALIALVTWVIASHACLLDEAGLTFGLGALSHHAPSGNADDGSQDGNGEEACCDELALVWSPAEKNLATNLCPLWSAFETAFDEMRLPDPAAGPDPPFVWPPGGQSFFSQLVGSSLYGRAPPVIG